VTRWAPERVQARVEIGAASRVGDAHVANEDQYFIGFVRPALDIAQTSVGTLVRDRDEERHAIVLAVADGVGRDGYGAIASREAIRCLASSLRQHQPSPLVAGRRLEPLRPRGGSSSLADVRAALLGAFALGNDRIQALARREGRPSCMASTLTVAYLRYPELHVAHVGDSRCHLLRRGHLHVLTRDHTLAEQLREEEIEVDEGSLFEHMLTHALGGGLAVHRPEMGRWSLEPGDVLLLCSDGVSDILEDEEMIDVLGQNASAEECARELVERAAEWDGRDDTTAVVARVYRRAATEDPLARGA
jgi:PPM family protein phosphatase